MVAGRVGTYGGGTLASSLVERSGNAKRTFFSFLAITALLASPFLAISFYFEDPLIFLGKAAIAELLIFAGTAPVNSLIVTGSPPKLLGFTQGATITSLNLFGAMIGPILVGRLADWSSLTWGMQVTTVSLLLAGLVWWRGRST